MLALTLVGLGAIGYFTGCNDKGNVNAPRQINFEMAQYVVIDYGDVQNAIEDGSIDTPMTFNSTMLGYNFLSGVGPSGRGIRRSEVCRGSIDLILASIWDFSSGNWI